MDNIIVLTYHDGKISEESLKVLEDLKEKYVDNPLVFNRFKRDLDNQPSNPYDYYSESCKFFRGGAWIGKEVVNAEYYISDKYLNSPQFKKDKLQSYKTQVLENYDNIFGFFVTKELLDIPEYKMGLFECRDRTFKEIKECMDRTVKEMEEMEMTYNASLEQSKK